MGSMFLENAEREQADSQRTVNAFAEVRGRKFFPVDGEFRLRGGGLSVKKSRCAKSKGQQDTYKTTAENARHHGERIPWRRIVACEMALLKRINTERISLGGIRRIAES